MEWLIKNGKKVLSQIEFYYCLRTCLLSLLILLKAADLLACPAFVFVHRLPLNDKTKLQRKQLRLYTLEKNQSGWYWRPKPFQIDPIDEQGRMRFPDSKLLLEENLSLNDRISFSLQEFSEFQFQGQFRLPCQATQGVYFRGGVDRHAYLFVCHDEKVAVNFPSPVQYNAEAQEVISKYYRYHHHPQNHLMFHEIAVQDESKFRPVSIEGDQLIRFDLKNFLTLNFGALDVEAKLINSRSGPVGLMGLLKFYINILAFEVEIALTPEVQFFSDALHMPMSLYSPLDAKRYLNSGSGIFYTWRSSSDVVWDFSNGQTIEYQSAERVDPIKFCRGFRCQFLMSGKIDHQTFSLKFSIPRYLVELGFYPQVVANTENIEKALGRQISGYGHAERIGFFFETSQLTKGNHDWDFWIHFGVPGESCPAEVKVHSL